MTNRALYLWGCIAGAVALAGLVQACAAPGVTVTCRVQDDVCVDESLAVCVVETYGDLSAGAFDPTDPLEVVHAEERDVAERCWTTEVGCAYRDRIYVSTERAIGHELPHVEDLREGGDGDWNHKRGDYEAGELATTACEVEAEERGA